MTSLSRAKRVVGKNIVLREVTEGDAEFIFDLRTDPHKSLYLSPTNGEVEDQVDWIRNYKRKNDQVYFVLVDQNEKRLGCVRLYDPRGDTYCWGSWLMASGLGPLVAIESALLVYAFGLLLGFKDVRLEVRRENESVWKFHEKFAGAQLISETDLDRCYLVKFDQVNELLKKYGNFLTSPLQVDWE